MLYKLGYGLSGIKAILGNKTLRTAFAFTTSLPSDFTTVRSTSGIARNSSGNWVSFTANTPRIDHDASGNPLGTRIEPATTNLCNHSNFAPTTIGGITIVSGDGTASVVADTSVSGATLDGSTFTNLQNGNVIKLTGGTTGTTYRISNQVGVIDSFSYSLALAGQGTGYHGNVKDSLGLGSTNYNGTSGAWIEVSTENFTVGSTTSQLEIYVSPSNTTHIIGVQFEQNILNSHPIVTTGNAGVTTGSEYIYSNLGTTVPWYNSSALKADNTLPDMIAQFNNDRYSVNQAEKNFSDLITFTRSSTATYEDSNGIIQSAAIDAPRFDYSSGSRKLLLEPAGTNLLTYSEEFDNNVWKKSDANVSANASVAPDGTNTMDTLVPSTSNIKHFVNQNIPITSGFTYTQSLYVRPNGHNYIQLTTSGGFPYSYMNFILIGTGSIGNTDGGSGTITKTATGLYRISYTLTSTSTEAVGRVMIVLINADIASRLPAFSGDGTSGVDVWGVQLETSDVATSYIPTIASTVTRAADSAVISGTNFSDWWNATEGTLYVDYRYNNSAVATSVSVITATNGTDANTYLIGNIGGVGNGSKINNTTTQAELTFGNPAIDTDYREALAYKSNDAASSQDGATTLTDTSVSLPTADRLNIGAYASSPLPLTGLISEIRFYPIRVTNSELERVTVDASTAETVTVPNVTWWNNAKGAMTGEFVFDRLDGSEQYAMLASTSGGLTNAVGMYLIGTSNQLRPRDIIGGSNKQNNDVHRPIEGRRMPLGISWKDDISISAAGAMTFQESTYTGSHAAMDDLYLGGLSGGSTMTGWIKSLTVWDSYVDLNEMSTAMFPSNGSYQAIMSSGQNNAHGNHRATDGQGNAGEAAAITEMDALWTTTENWLIDAAVDGAALTEANNATNNFIATGGGDGTSMTRAKRIANAFGLSNIKAIIWDQGASDTGDLEATIKANTQTVFDKFRSYIGSIPILTAPIAARADSTVDAYNKVKRAQEGIATDNAWAYLTPPQNNVTFGSDNIHLSDASYGAEMTTQARKALATIGETISGAIDPPSVASATRSSTTVTVNMTLPSGITAITPTSSIAGFRFFDDSVEIAITAATYASSVITLTLASTPTGVEELYFGYGSMYAEIANIANFPVGNDANTIGVQNIVT